MHRKTTTLADRFWPKVKRSSDCWTWTASTNSNGDGQIWVMERRRAIPSNQAAWLLVTGSLPPKGMDVCHTCDIRLCVRNDDAGVYVVDGIEYERYGHLWLGTRAANLADMSAKGRSLSGRTFPERPKPTNRHWTHVSPERIARGERGVHAKLTDTIVLEIRKRYALGDGSQSALAREYGISQSSVSLIVLRKKWAHI